MKAKPEIVVDSRLVAFCGLYCGACKAYLKGRCPGCQKSEKKGWCKIRQCNLDGGLESCAACPDFKDVAQCRKLNRFWFRFFAPIMGYDMPAGVRLLAQIGAQAYAKKLAEERSMWVKRAKRGRDSV